jgi:phosphatidate phosphatase PAH1
MSVRLLAFGALLVVAAGAQGQSIYTCKDRTGHTLTSDRPIAECAGVMRELGPSGTVRREIAPPLTPEQLKEKEATDRTKKQAEEVLREQHRRDVALLTAYQSEDQIEAARKRALADPQEGIKSSQERLADLDEERQGLVKELDAYKGKAVPPSMKRKVDDNQALIDDESASIKSRNVEIVRINQRYDEDRKRFRELTASNRK